MINVRLISDSILNLSKDFTGISFNLVGFLSKFWEIVFVLLIMLFMYLLGRVILSLLKIKKSEIDSPFLYALAVGYISMGTIIFFLGLFGLLMFVWIILLLVVFLVFTFWQLNKNPIYIKLKLTKPNLLQVLLFLILLIGILRLLPPQTAGDPLDYHLRFPRLYVQEGTIMVPPLGDESYIGIPQLPEMLYVLSEVVSHGEASRIIHYAFFALLVIAICRINILDRKNAVASMIGAILLATAPIFFKISTAAFSDFPSLLTMYLSLGIISVKRISKRQVLLSAILFGGAMAGKIWMLYFLPFMVFLLFLNTKEKLKKKIIQSLIFALVSLIVTFPWYVRSFILSGNPFYINDHQGQIDKSVSVISNFINHYIFFFDRVGPNFSDYGAFFLVGLALALLSFRKIKSRLVIIIFFAAAFLLPIPLARGRYSMPYMIPLFLLAGLGFSYFWNQKFMRVVFYVGTTFLILYYLLNTMIILPYGLGWASKEQFLKRSLSADGKAYYDFNGEFKKNISSRETVITYGMNELYYAHFKYKNLYYFYNQEAKLFKLPTEINKILIRGGDFNWLCSTVGITNCSIYAVELLTYDTQTNLYLYGIKYNYAK